MNSLGDLIGFCGGTKKVWSSNQTHFHTVRKGAGPSHTSMHVCNSYFVYVYICIVYVCTYVYMYTCTTYDIYVSKYN